MTQSNTQLYDLKGRRKYLNKNERTSFLKAVNLLQLERRIFCLVLLYTGCRISEAIQLTKDRIDLHENLIVFHTLKKREDQTDVIYQRAVPVPARLIKALLGIFRDDEERIWGFSRTTGWRIVKNTMKLANVYGIQACAKGLRHGFGIACAEKNIPISLISVWMGHSSIKTTMIYLDAVGIEEREFMRRTWDFGKKILLFLDFTGENGYLK